MLQIALRWQLPHCRKKPDKRIQNPLGSILTWKSQRKHCLICRNGGARVCDKWNEKDRKDTAGIHSLKLKPFLFLILSLGYLIPDPSQVML